MVLLQTVTHLAFDNNRRINDLFEDAQVAEEEDKNLVVMCHWVVRLYL